MFRVNIQLVSYHIWVNARHVLVWPCKYVGIFLQQGFEVVLSIFREQGLYPYGFDGVRWVHLD